MAGGDSAEAIPAVTGQKLARGGRRAPPTELEGPLPEFLGEKAQATILAAGVWQWRGREFDKGQCDRPLTPSPHEAL